MSGVMSAHQALALEERFGGRFVGDRLAWVEVTVVGDRERQFLLQTARCAYCGRPRPAMRCESCGAGVPDGEV